MTANDAREAFTEALTQVLIEAEREAAAAWIDGTRLVGERVETRRTITVGTKHLRFSVLTVVGAPPETQQEVHLLDTHGRPCRRPTRH